MGPKKQKVYPSHSNNAEQSTNSNNYNNYNRCNPSFGNFSNLSRSEEYHQRIRPRFEESINRQYILSTGSHHQYFYPNQIAYRNYSHYPPAFQPHLPLNCFHRADLSSRTRQQHDREPRSGDNRMGGLRYWEKLTPNSSQPGLIFTVMSYNVLAQDLLVKHPELYQLHNRNNLKWHFRWENILAEIKHTNPDILCLQEVQNSHQNSHFSVLETMGYSSIYKQRTGDMTDGCAIYFKTDHLTLIEFITVEYKQSKTALLDRNNIAIIARFAPKSSPTTQFVVATTHLLYNPKREDVRLAQTQLLLTEIERMAFTCNTTNKYVPVILTGDFNSPPNSPVYQFVTEGKLEYENLAPRSMQPTQTGARTGKTLVGPGLGITDECQHANLLAKRENKEKMSRNSEWELIRLEHSEKSRRGEVGGVEETPKCSTGTLSHRFGFKSVYKHFDRGDNEGTTFQFEWLTVDYIFYSKFAGGNLVLLDRFRLPTKNQLGDLKIPSSWLGSDHLSLIAKFKLTF